MLSLDHFLLIRAIKFLGANLIFIIRIYNFFLFFSALVKCRNYLNHDQEQTTNNQQPTTHTASRGSSIYISSGKSSQFQMSHS